MKIDIKYIKEILRYKKCMYLKLRKDGENLAAIRHLFCVHVPYDMKKEKLNHIRYAKFEWQYWIGFKNGKIYPEDIPTKNMKEMIAHMAVMAENRGEDLQSWYFKRKDQMILSESTKYWIEKRIARDLY